MHLGEALDDDVSRVTVSRETPTLLAIALIRTITTAKSP